MVCLCKYQVKQTLNYSQNVLDADCQTQRRLKLMIELYSPFKNKKTSNVAFSWIITIGNAV
jgi:hypothetical protein